MIRKKHGLNPVIEPIENQCETFYEAIDIYLNSKYPSVIKLADTYKTEYMNDIFFKYYDGDRKAMGKVGMEEKKNLEHRFDIWKVNC